MLWQNPRGGARVDSIRKKVVLRTCACPDAFSIAVVSLCASEYTRLYRDQYSCDWHQVKSRQMILYPCLSFYGTIGF